MTKILHNYNNNNNNSSDKVLSSWLHSKDWFVEILALIVIGQNKSFGYSFLPSSKTLGKLSYIFQKNSENLDTTKRKINYQIKTKTDLYTH